MPEFDITSVFSSSLVIRIGDIRTSKFDIIACSDQGGGGERVLWVMIAALLGNRDTADAIHIVIYSADRDKTKNEIISNVQVPLFSRAILI